MLQLRKINLNFLIQSIFIDVTVNLGQIFKTYIEISDRSQLHVTIACTHANINALTWTKEIASIVIIKGNLSVASKKNKCSSTLYHSWHFGTL